MTSEVGLSQGRGNVWQGRGRGRGENRPYRSGDGTPWGGRGGRSDDPRSQRSAPGAGRGGQSGRCARPGQQGAWHGNMKMEHQGGRAPRGSAWNGQSKNRPGSNASSGPGGPGRSPRRNAWNQPGPNPWLIPSNGEDVKTDEQGVNRLTSDLKRQLDMNSGFPDVHGLDSQNDLEDYDSLARRNPDNIVRNMVGTYHPEVRDPSNTQLHIATREWDKDALELGCRLLNEGKGRKMAAREAGVIVGDLVDYWETHYAHDSEDDYDDDYY